MKKGFVALILHAHLPFVRHPEYEYFLEENWFYEAVVETYIPLLTVLEKLVNDKVPFRITISLSPPLLNMLSDPLLQKRTTRYIEKLIELSEKEIIRTKKEPKFNRLAKIYNEKFKKIYSFLTEKYKLNLINAFKKMQDEGVVELITSAATHGYLPLLSINKKAVKAQVMVGAKEYERFFGKKAHGIWLPECAYEPGLEQFLAEANFSYFFTDTHGILFATPRPKYGVFAPVLTPSKVAAFGRDTEVSKQVWSAKEGYPGDYNYRDFYRDIGFDLDLEYIRPYIHPMDIRIPTGIKYYKITGKTDNKLPYDPDAGIEKAAEHAGNFMFNREKQVEYLYSILKREPIIVAPYDAELFGHWWYEGPIWIEFLFRKTAYEQKTFSFITPGDYLDRFKKLQIATPSMSSWGYKGYHEVWLNGTNDWIYPHLHKAADIMVEMANIYKDTSDPIIVRALNQAARELLLAQSSDWAFIMTTGTDVSYAKRRVKEHILNFLDLTEAVKKNNINLEKLEKIEEKNNIFPEIDFRVYV